MTNVDLADLLRVHCRGQGREKVIYSWAVHYSRRRKLVAENRARRTAARVSSGRRPAFGTFGLESYGSGRRDPGYGSAPGSEGASAAEAEAERIVRVLNEYATAARAETVWAEGTVAIAGAAGCRARRRLADAGRRSSRRARPRSPAIGRLARAADQHLEPRGPSSPCSSPR